MPNTPLKGDYNTYIGARYVPIIGGMWNQQTEYEPLTIVMYQGSSYTSKTFVPKGTQIDNTTYWVRTANYDEQVEFYRSEVQQFKKDIDANEAEYIATVQTAQTQYENKITNQQNQYEKTMNDKYSVALQQVIATASSATAPIFVDSVSKMSDTTKAYVLASSGNIYYYNGSSWVDSQIKYGDVISYLKFTSVVIPNKVETILPTLSTAEINTMYIVVCGDYIPTDFPDTHKISATGTNVLITIGDKGYKRQYLIPAVFDSISIATRSYYNNEYHDWTYTVNSNDLLKTFNVITSDTYTVALPKLENAGLNSIYTLNFTKGSKYPDDYPADLVRFGDNKLLLTIAYNSGTPKFQFIIDPLSGGIVAYRSKYGTWSGWVKCGLNNEIYVGANEQFTTIKEAFEYAYNNYNTTVHIKNGTYDIAKEFTDAYGSTYFDSDDFTNSGIRIGHGNKYYFEQGAVVNCVLPKTASATATNTFSPFCADRSDFEITGLTLNSENCRYSVHDEAAGKGTYHHIYKECKFHHNKSTGSGYNQCIGGGLGAHALIEVNQCEFESTGAADDFGIVSWHNGFANDIKSSIYIHDCYFVNGCARLSWYGTSTEITKMYLNNNSFITTAYQERAETADYNVVNTKIIAWNNNIRS